MDGLNSFVKEFEESKKEVIFALPISEVCSKYLGKLISIKGIIKSFTAILPNKKITYKCNRCNKISFTYCESCFKCNGSVDKITEIKDSITAILEEDYPDNNRLPISLVIQFNKNLDKALNDLNLGSKYEFVGRLLIDKKNKSDFFLIEVSSYVYLKEGLEKLNITPEEKVLLKAYSNDTDDLLERLRNTIFGIDLIGMNNILDSVILMMVSSPKKMVGNNVLKNRGNLMILIIGSPGTGKSQVLKRTVAFFPKGRYATCSGSTAIGLIASVQKDERVGDYVLSPGAVALANKSICAIDELDKVDKNDLTKLNTMMDSLVIPIDKANIHRKLKADVSILGAMNPKYGTFDDNTSIYEQINLKKDFLDRFDLIWNMDYFQKRTDGDQITDKSLDAYGLEEEPKLMPIELAQKYFAYAKTINPKVDIGVREDISKEFKKLTQNTNLDNKAYFSRRLLDNLVRLAQAYCRLKLKDEMDSIDVQLAIDLMKCYLKTMGVYQEVGGLDQYKCEEVVTSEKVKLAETILKIISSFKGIPVHIEEIYTFLNNTSQRDVDQMISKLKQKGDIFEPSSNKYKIY